MGFIMTCPYTYVTHFDPIQTPPPRPLLSPSHSCCSPSSSQVSSCGSLNENAPPWGLQKWPLSPSLKTGAVCRCPVLLALGLLLQAPHLHLLTTFPATVNSHPLELWAKVNPSFYNCLGCAALAQELVRRLLLFRCWIQRAVYVAFQPLLQNSGLTCG